MMNRVLTMGIMLVVSLCWNTVAWSQQQVAPIRYFTEPTLPQDVYLIHPIPIDTGETAAPKDTLFQLMSLEGKPVSYYRSVVTEVCFDNSCRLLRVNLYWNVTGRYLGFELPPHEFLSKAEHEPFTLDEYLRLHDILTDSLSPIGSFTYEELVPMRPVIGVLDGITGATSQNVLQYVVKGAVFTTYTIWNLIYGDTQREVVKATEQALDANYLLAILNSASVWDRHWALNRLSLLSDTPGVLKDRVLDLVCSESYNLAAHAIEAVPQAWCAESAFQQALWAEFDCVQYALKPALLRKIGACDHPDDTVLLDIARHLPPMNGPVLTAGLESLRKYLPENQALLLRVAALLDHENRFVANQVKKFLDEVTADNLE